jgi:hypothetical protein
VAEGDGVIEQERMKLAVRLAERMVEGNEVWLAAERAMPHVVGSRFGRRDAVVAACFECWLAAVEFGEEWSGSAPAAVGLHARRAAREGVSESGLRDGYEALRDLLWRTALEEAEHVAASEVLVLLRQVWAACESLFSHVQVEAGQAYRREAECATQTPQLRRAAAVRRLLQGDRTVDVREIHHDFAGQHLGLIASGDDAMPALRAFEQRAGLRLFCLPEEEGIVTGWLSLRGEMRPETLERYLPEEEHLDLVLGVGCSSEGIRGFCATHRMASEAFEVAQLRGLRRAWYADVELDALLLRDPELARSLIAAYVAPLEPAVLAMLQAHNRAGWNESATARAMDVSRNSVREKLKNAKTSSGRHFSEHRGSVELALRAVDLGMLAHATNQTATSVFREQPVQFSCSI